MPTSQRKSQATDPAETTHINASKEDPTGAGNPADVHGGTDGAGSTQPDIADQAPASVEQTAAEVPPAGTDFDSRLRDAKQRAAAATSEDDMKAAQDDIDKIRHEQAAAARAADPGRDRGQVEGRSARPQTTADGDAGKATGE